MASMAMGRLPDSSTGMVVYVFFFSSRRRHTRLQGDWSSDVCSSDLGSIDYINTLAPPGKKVKVLLWPGSCSPSAKAVKMTQDLGVFNVNGGGATRTKDRKSVV